MTKKRKTPENHPYSSFDAIGVNGEVHLRIVGQTVDDEIAYENAKLMTQPNGDTGHKSASFFVPSLGPNGQTVPNISESMYVAWTRY